MKAEEIRELPDNEVEDRIAQAREELFRLRFRSATQQIEDPSLIRKLRRDIARMMTILRQRQTASSGAAR